MGLDWSFLKDDISSHKLRWVCKEKNTIVAAFHDWNMYFNLLRGKIFFMKVEGYPKPLWYWVHNDHLPIPELNRQYDMYRPKTISMYMMYIYI